MTVHVLRAQGVLFANLTCLFGANPESWEEAVLRLSKGEVWHAEIAKFIDRFGRDTVLAALRGANPAKKRFQRELKRQRRWVAYVEPAVRQRNVAYRR